MECPTCGSNLAGVHLKAEDAALLEAAKVTIATSNGGTYLSKGALELLRAAIVAAEPKEGAK